MPSPQDKKILLVIGVNSFFYHQFSLAQVLCKSGLTPLLFFDIEYATREYDLKKCDEQGIQYIIGSENKAKDPGTGFLSRIKNQGVRIFQKIEYRVFSRFFREWLRSRKVYNAFANTINENGVGAVVMVSDLVQSDSGIYIKAAHDQNVRVLIIPLYAANYKEAAGHHYNDPKVQISARRYRFLKNRKRLAKWVIAFHDRYMIRLPLSYILVKEAMGTAPVNPWTINSGDFDIMAVEGEAVKRLYVSSGDFNPSKIVVTGSLSTDKIYHNLLHKENKMNGFYQEYGLDPAKKNLLVAIPPDMFYSRGNQTEYASYADFVKFWVSHINTLAPLYNILYTIHPSVDKKDHVFFVDLGCGIIHGPTIDYIALFDLYIASISATIQWAALSGIPVINHDIYRYDYDDYRNVAGVLYAVTNEEFKKIIDDFKDYDFLAKITARQKAHSSDWGVLDGRGGERLVSCVKECMQPFSG